MIARALAFALMLNGATAVSIRSQASKSPVKKVLSLLQNMQLKVKAEGLEHSAVFDKYACFCKKSQTTLQDQQRQVEEALPQLRSRVREMGATRASLDSEIQQHNQMRDDGKKVIARAAEIRDKESQQYFQDEQSQKEIIQSLRQAIQSLAAGQQGVFLQTKSAETLRRLSLSADMTTSDRDMLSSFLSQGDSLAPSNTNGLLAMLKQIEEETSTDYEHMKKQEMQRIAEHRSLMDANSKQLSAAMQAIEEKMNRLMELKVEFVKVKADLKIAEESAKETASFSADLATSCQDKKQEWQTFEATRVEEMEALAKLVTFLDSGEIRNVIQSAKNSSALVQTANETMSPASTLSFLQLADGAAQDAWPRGEGLDLIELAMRQKPGAIKGVVGKIDTMRDVLQKQGQSDEEHRLYCEAKLSKASAAKEDKNRDIDDATSIMATLVNELGTVGTEIQALQEQLTALDQQVQQTTSDRKEEHMLVVHGRTDNAAAADVLDLAQKHLAKSHASSLYQASKATAHVAGKSSGTKKDSADQANSHNEKGPSEMFKLFQAAQDIIKQKLSLLAKSDKSGQARYESFVRHSNAKKDLTLKNLGSKQEAKAELEVALEKSKEGIRSKREVLSAIEDEIRGLHADCDFLLKNFELRRDARKTEQESLARAKGTLQATVEDGD